MASIPPGQHPPEEQLRHVIKNLQNDNLKIQQNNLQHEPNLIRLVKTRNAIAQHPNPTRSTPQPHLRVHFHHKREGIFLTISQHIGKIGEQDPD